MNRFGIVFTPLMTLMLVLLSACATQPAPVTPATTPTIAPAQPLPVVTTPTAVADSRFTGEDAAWPKVIADAKKEGKVTLYSYGFISDAGNAISIAFKNKYGVTVELITGTGSQLIPRIQSEHRSGQYVADILEGSSINAIFARKQGLTQPYGDLPELREKDVWVVDPHFDKEGHIIAYTYSIYPLWINTKLLNPADAPKSWKELLDPKWKGKIVVTDPDTMPIPNKQFIVLTRYLGFSEDYFRELGKQDLVFAPNQRENDAMVARGQYSITLTSGPTSMGPLIAEGAPVVPIDLAEGVHAEANPTITIMAKAPHPNASRVFLDWLMSKDGQNTSNRAKSIASIRKDVTDYSPPQIRIKYTRLVPLNQQDLEDAAQVQQDKILSKIWRKK